MNFNKNYPIAILDTNIVMDFPNILEILKGCNIVIPYTLIDELDKLKKEKKGARDFVNNFLDLSEKANLSKDGYKLENDCMLYLDIDKDNSHHKDINLDSKKEDIKFIAETKNLKEKYNDMAVVLISSDKIMKITASNFEVEVKTLEEFISQYINYKDRNAILDILYNLSGEYLKNRDKENLELMYEMIYQIEVNTNNIDGLFKLAKESSYYKNKIYKKIIEILVENKDIDRLFKLAEDEEFDYYESEIYKKIIEILVENKDIDGLFKLAEESSYDENEIYEKIYEIAVSNKNINALSKLQSIYYEKYKEDNRKYDEDKLNTINNYKRRLKDLEKDLPNRLINYRYFYRLPKREDYEKYKYIYEERDSINAKIVELSRTYYKGPNLPYYKELSNTIEELSQLENKKVNILSESKDIDGLYKLAKTYNNAYNKIFGILSENKDIDGLYKLYESYKSKKIYKRIFEILSENKDTEGLFKLSESYKSEEIYKRIFEILVEAEDLEGLFKLAGSYNYKEVYEKIYKILEKEEDKNRLYKLIKNEDVKNILSNYKKVNYYSSRGYDNEHIIKIHEKIFKILIDKIEELENNK